MRSSLQGALWASTDASVRSSTAWMRKIERNERLSSRAAGRARGMGARLEAVAVELSSDRLETVLEDGEFGHIEGRRL
jgi:hypothetical protein